MEHKIGLGKKLLLFWSLLADVIRLYIDNVPAVDRRLVCVVHDEAVDAELRDNTAKLLLP